jgi:hypothetical protein
LAGDADAPRHIVAADETRARLLRGTAAAPTRTESDYVFTFTMKRAQRNDGKLCILMIGHFADWFNSRRWFIRYLLFAEWVILVTLAAFLSVLVF